MKPRLQTSLGQHLVLTPQLRQAIHLLQLSATELEAELSEAVETNPLLDWVEAGELRAGKGEEAGRDDGGDPRDAPPGDEAVADEAPPWSEAEEPWRTRGARPEGEDGDGTERLAGDESLQDHLRWQLQLSHLSDRDARIGLALVDAIDDDGYLREPLEALREALRPDLEASPEELQAMLRRLQGLDPPGVGARDLGECLALQLAQLDPGTPARDLAQRIVAGPLERLPRSGIDGVAAELGCPPEAVQAALQLLRTLDPRPGARFGSMPPDTYVTPDCVIWRRDGVWRVALAGSHAPRLTINRAYEGMIAGASSEDAGYLRGRLQEARWLLRNLEARGETLLKVVQCLVRQQSGFLEFGDQALRPLTLREVAGEVGLHESTVSRAVARKYVRTPRGTIPLRSFFASGIDTGAGGGTSSTAIQSMIRRLVDAEDPRKPLSDARIADMLKANGIPVARRTVAKYREAMHIPSSHDRIRIA